MLIRNCYIKVVLLSLFFIGTDNSTRAQDYSTFSISLADGLSQSSVYTLDQDSSGFIWAGTQDGLNRYDGQHFKIYYNQPFDSLSLPSSNVMSLLHDSKGRFWIGTSSSGLALMAKNGSGFYSWGSTGWRANDKLSSNWINLLYEDKAGRIWAGTGMGLNLILPDQKVQENGTASFVSRLFDSTGVSFNAITTLFSGSENDLWVGTQAGIRRLSINGTNLSSCKVRTYTSVDGINAESIKSILGDQYGHIWVATLEGLYLYSPKSDAFLKISIDENTSGTNEVLCLLNSSDGKLWLGTAASLYYLNPEELKAVDTRNISFTKFCSSGVGLRSSILNLKEDKISKGIIWAGTDADGIFKIVPRFKHFTTNHLNNAMPLAFVFSILQDRNDDYLWIGTSTGLIRYDREKQAYSIFKAEKDGLLNNYINCIKQDEDGTIWLATFNGLQKIENPKSAKPTFVSKIVNKEIPKVQVRKIYFAGDGTIYAVLPRRIYRLDKNGNNPRLVLDSKTCSVIPENAFNSDFLIDKEENMWLSSSAGLFVFRNKGNGEFDFNNPLACFHDQRNKSSLRNDAINDLFEDSKGNIWICTANGLSKANLIQKKILIKNYSSDDGLINNAVYGMLEDTSTGMLWMSTNGGLSRFDPVNIVFKNYNVHDGLQSNEFNAGAFFQSDKHEFYFGGVNGYTSFFPNEIKEDTIKPKVFIAGLTVPGGESADFLSNGKNKEIKLDYSQNSFSVNFIALQYSNPAANQYAYMLEGFHKNWINSGTLNQINFSQLPPGNYVLRVKASNADGVFNETGDSISIIIHPPFWNTLWFYLIIATLVFLVFYALHRYKLRMSSLQHAEIEKIRKETAADFHDELGHKLTTISWFAEILKKRMGPEMAEEKTYLDKIIETSANLYHTMKDLLWAMDPGKDSLNDLYLQMRHFGESLYDQTGVEFVAGDADDKWSEIHLPLAQKRHVLLIFKEAMHNSLKHSHSSKIELGAFRQNGHVAFTLRDNGKGFKFDWDIAGNGLRNVKKRAEQIKGRLEIFSDKEGTKIELKVPIQN